MNKLLTCSISITASIILLGTHAAEAVEVKSEIKTTPVIEFYGKHGETDYKCEFTLSTGYHRFSNNSCPNDDVYSFKIKNPKEGYVIFMENSPSCSPDESWASYLVKDPFPMDPTQRMNVDAGYGLDMGTEIVPGIQAGMHKNRDQLVGKVSCVYVRIDDKASNPPHASHIHIPSE